MGFSGFLLGMLAGCILMAWSMDNYIASCAKNGKKIEHDKRWYKVVEIAEPETEKE